MAGVDNYAPGKHKYLYRNETTQEFVWVEPDELTTPPPPKIKFEPDYIEGGPDA